jgi:hypothetical protein
MTTIVVPVTSRRLGHDTLLSSFRVSLRKSTIPRNQFLSLLKKSFMSLTPQIFSRQPRKAQLGRQAENGRPGGTRTPNMRFWRPPLYHSSYWPVQIWSYKHNAALNAFPYAAYERGSDYRISLIPTARSSFFYFSSTCNCGFCT